MSSTNTRLATVRTAERRGPDRPTEDRIFTTPNAVIVLDGASQPDASDHDGGWLADTLGRQLAHRLTDEAGLRAVLRDAIATVAHRYDLTPGDAPSTTVSIVRWTTDTVDAMVLGDSPVTALTHTGDVDQVRDGRLARVAAQHRNALPRLGFGTQDRDRWRALVDAERARRNQPGGYWIAEATPEAADHALHRQWRRDDLTAILVMTDGVTAGVDRYRTPGDWPTAIAIARDDPGRLVNLVHDTEATDPDGVRRPRSKRHDDKALAAIGVCCTDW